MIWFERKHSPEFFDKTNYYSSTEFIDILNKEVHIGKSEKSLHMNED